jgi:hemin uptake protein HemP
MSDDPKSRERKKNAPRATEPAPIIYQSEEILRGRGEVFIEHKGEMYRLRLTSAGKLYLTK